MKRSAPFPTVVDVTTVRDFVARHVAAPDTAGIRHLAVGDFSTWIVADKVIVRFASNDQGDLQLQREAAALPVVAPRLNAQVPQIETLAESAIGHLAVAYRCIPGVSGEELRPQGTAFHAAADAVADCLLRLHAIDPEEIGTLLPEPDVDYAATLAAVVERSSVVREAAASMVTPLMRTFLEGTVPVPGDCGGRAVCHTDLKGEHVLLDAETSSINGIIDWADVALDDPAVDIGSLAIWLGEDFVRAVADGYGAPRELVERGLFRIRTWILIGFADALAGKNSWPLELVRRQVAFAFRQ